MLSRVDDARVFESSEDVIFASSSRQRHRHGAAQQLGTEANEDEQLHPQHPYRMRKRVLRRESGEFSSAGRDQDGELVAFRRQDQRPMQFVFLSSGEIRAREDCPPGLELPKLQHRQHYEQPQKPRLQYQGEDSGRESESEEEADRRQGPDHRADRQVKTARQTQRQPQRVDSLSSSSSGRSASSESENADVSSDDDSDSTASKLSDERGNQKEDQTEHQVQSRRHTTRRVERQGKSHERSAARNSVKRMPIRSLKLDRLCIEDEGSGHAQDRASVQRTAVFREEKAPSRETTPRGSRQRPAPLEKVEQLEDTHDVPTRRTKRSPKMEVSHLVSEEPTPKPKGRTASSARREEEMIDRLESELQKEKKRVLEKMTQLLDEQGKNQQLRDRVEALGAQLAAKDSEKGNNLREAARNQEEQLQSTETDQAARMNALEEQARAQEAKIVRLKHEKDQLKSAVKQLKNAGSNLSNDTQESAVLRLELDGMRRRLHDFLAKVERWKSNSKEAMRDCDDKTGLPALLERVWLEFPQFPGVSVRPSKGNPSPTSQQSQQSTLVADEQADAVLFLKKRLRQREDELRQTHVKYVELKELCARQCVREADLQNFINEHRLRGNLIIRKNSETESGIEPNGTANNQEQPLNDHQDEHRRSAKLKMISSRGTNTPAFNNERGEDEDDFVNDEYSDNQEDNDGYEEEEDEEDEYPVRTPKVFVQVGRDGVYEHASPTNSAVAQKLAADRSRGKRKAQSKQQHQQQRVERIRLVPSPSLAQRYERVPTPTMNTAQRKKCGHLSLPQPSSRTHHTTLGECPPGCGSRLSFTRKKAASTAPRTKLAKRPVAMAASKGAVGVIRPWM